MVVPLEIESVATDEEKSNAIEEVEAFRKGLKTKCARLVEKIVHRTWSRGTAFKKRQWTVNQ